MSDKVAKERMYFNADRTELVSEDHPDARFLAAAVGDELPEVRLKQAPAAENKAAKPVSNKGG